MNLGKPATETFEMLCELLENIPYTRQGVLNGDHVSTPVECQLKMTNIRGNKTSDQLWSLSGDLNRKFEHVLHCCEVRSSTLHK
jgi:hypothetical protein